MILQTICGLMIYIPYIFLVLLFVRIGLIVRKHMRFVRDNAANGSAGCRYDSLLQYIQSKSQLLNSTI